VDPIVVSLEDVANIVTFIAPGYFVIQIYSLIYAKKDRGFSRLLIESVVYSLPIITIVNIMWQHVFWQPPVSNVSVGYTSLILVTSLVIGSAAALLRTRWPVKNLGSAIGLGSPHEDFVKAQLLRVQTNDPTKNAVTVKLKSGAIFSGTSDRISRYNHSGPSYYYFANLAWFNETTDEWDEREGGIIVKGDEIEYIETAKLSD